VVIWCRCSSYNSEVLEVLGVRVRVRVMADAERLEAGVKLQQSAAGAVACREQHFRRPPTERRNDDVRVPHERGV